MTTPWRLARSLETLRGQINTLAPGRNKDSDGTIGDAAHAARTSDHNVKNGVVHALDITHDPRHGIDIATLGPAILATRDSRIDYVIFNRQISFGRAGPRAWTLHPYHGTSPHTEHLHISVLDDPRYADNEGVWLLHYDAIPDLKAPNLTMRRPTLRGGSEGPFVDELCGMLQISVQPFFNAAVLDSVKSFQYRKGLVVDGVVGPYTWAMLEKGTKS